MNAHQLTLFGLALCALGALVIAIGALAMVLGNRSYHGPSEAAHRREKLAYLLGAVLLGLGFVLQLIAVQMRP